MLKTLKLFMRRKERTRFAIKKLNKEKRARFSVYRSNAHIYAQIIDDTKSITLISASTIDQEIKGSIVKTSDVEAARKVGELIAKRAVAANIKQVVFDKGGYVYHGRIKALADAARSGGLEF